MPESLPDNILEELSWPKLADALVLAHKPKSLSGTMLDSPARQRLAFEELCMQQAQLALARWRLKHVGVASGSTEVMYPTWQSSSLVLEAISKLPFELRESQKTCLEEMWSDAIGGENGRMIRLLQVSHFFQ